MHTIVCWSKTARFEQHKISVLVKIEQHKISVLVNFEQHTIVCTSKLAVDFKLDVIRNDGASDNIK